MTTMKNLERLPSLNALAPRSSRAFWAFDEAALAEGAIPSKYKELMAVSVALTTQCAYCLEIHRDRALQAGVTYEELSEAVFVTAALRAGAAATHGTHLLSGVQAEQKPSPTHDHESRDQAEATPATW